MADTLTLTEKLAAARDRAVTKAPPRIRPQAAKLTKEKSVKVGVFGPIGAGKTSFLLGPLLCGERILSMSTDFGGHGLISVQNELERIGREDLLDNLLNVDLANYDDTMEFLERPNLFVPDMEAFAPTTLFWDGFSTFNVTYLDVYSDENPDKIVPLGKGDKYEHWYGIKRATSHAFTKFFAFRTGAATMNKIMTLIEAKTDINDLTQEKEKAPMIQGGAKDLSTGGFDVVLNCYCEEADGKFQYYYRCKGASGKFAVKSRGFNLQPVEKAEPERIWKLLTGKGEGK